LTFFSVLPSLAPGVPSSQKTANLYFRIFLFGIRPSLLLPFPRYLFEDRSIFFCRFFLPCFFFCVCFCSPNQYSRAAALDRTPGFLCLRLFLFLSSSVFLFRAFSPRLFNQISTLVISRDGLFDDLVAAVLSFPAPLAVLLPPVFDF